jgi:hypothetical protein
MEHQFRPVEKEAVHDFVELKKDVINKNLDKTQYSFEKKYPPVPAAFDMSLNGHGEVPYSINRTYLQIRPGIVYNTINKNCKKEFDNFFRNAGSYDN